MEIIERCSIVILSVKPHILESVLNEIKDHVKEHHFIVSIVTGKSLSLIENEIPNIRVARLVVNTPALVGEMAGAFAMGSATTKDDCETVNTLMKAWGVGFQVKEELLDSVTGLAGSGPAYVFMFIESLADGGVKQGLPRNIAL